MGPDHRWFGTPYSLQTITSLPNRLDVPFGVLRKAARNCWRRFPVSPSGVLDPMQIQFVEIRNFRKLKSIRVDFALQKTLFVGANNSGKTSAMDALGLFLVSRGHFTASDFTLSNWARINEIGKRWEGLENEDGSPGPSLDEWEALLPCLDVWLDVRDGEVHYVSHLLPTLDWEGGLLGVRLRLEPEDTDRLYKEYISATRRAEETKKAAATTSGPNFQAVALWPRRMSDFLERRLTSVFTVRGYSLDAAKLTRPVNGVALPQALPPGSAPIEGNPLEGLICVDMIPAQRDFADAVGGSSGAAGGRGGAGRLSAQLRSYFDKHLNPLESPEPSDLGALRAIQEAEKLFDEKLRTGFSAALGQVENLGYPGVTDPKLTIATKVRLTDGLDHEAAVQYDVLPGSAPDSGPSRLPEDRNGLGYQNLISMVFRLMGFRDGWMQVGKAAKTAQVGEGEGRSPEPLHLVLVEEPEAHLHAQVQQVFINKAYELLRAHADLGTNTRLTTQLVVSTHSSHVAHECEFSCLRYFRRRPALKVGEAPTATVANLSEVFGGVSDTKRFVTRYLKATHCDLFFADAAILVEGPAERILVPHFVRAYYPRLRQSYLTLLEIGGSHAHRLRPLIKHLGLTTLVVTDLDAAESPGGAAVPPARGRGQVTRNATLKGWLPRKESLDELLDTEGDQKVVKYDELFSVRVAYQCPVKVALGDAASPVEVLPNTFEDALAYENLRVFRDTKGNGEMRRLRDAIGEYEAPGDLAKRMFEGLGKLRKAELALDLLELAQEPWRIAPPAYIREGLAWLDEQLQRKQQDLLDLDGPVTVEGMGTQ
jgi:predicted ATP-dependent endonuclease of OLD family